MSKMERPPVAGLTQVTDYRGPDIRLGFALGRPLAERLVIFTLFAGWIGFWLTVIWWWMAR